MDHIMTEEMSASINNIHDLYDYAKNEYEAFLAPMLNELIGNPPLPELPVGNEHIDEILKASRVRDETKMHQLITDLHDTLVENQLPTTLPDLSQCDTLPGYFAKSEAAALLPELAAALAPQLLDNTLSKELKAEYASVVMEIYGQARPALQQHAVKHGKQFADYNLAIMGGRSYETPYKIIGVEADIACAIVDSKSNEGETSVEFIIVQEEDKLDESVPFNVGDTFYVQTIGKFKYAASEPQAPIDEKWEPFYEVMKELANKHGRQLADCTFGKFGDKSYKTPYKIIDIDDADQSGYACAIVDYPGDRRKLPIEFAIINEQDKLPNETSLRFKVGATIYAQTKGDRIYIASKHHSIKEEFGERWKTLGICVEEFVHDTETDSLLREESASPGTIKNQQKLTASLDKYEKLFERMIKAKSRVDILLSLNTQLKKKHKADTVNLAEALLRIYDRTVQLRIFNARNRTNFFLDKLQELKAQKNDEVFEMFYQKFVEETISNPKRPLQIPSSWSEDKRSDFEKKITDPTLTAIDIASNRLRKRVTEATAPSDEIIASNCSTLARYKNNLLLQEKIMNRPLGLDPAFLKEKTDLEQLSISHQLHATTLVVETAKESLRDSDLQQAFEDFTAYFNATTEKIKQSLGKLAITPGGIISREGSEISEAEWQVTLKTLTDFSASCIEQCQTFQSVSNYAKVFQQGAPTQTVHSSTTRRRNAAGKILHSYLSGSEALAQTIVALGKLQKYISDAQERLPKQERIDNERLYGIASKFGLDTMVISEASVDERMEQRLRILTEQKKVKSDMSFLPQAASSSSSLPVPANHLSRKKRRKFNREKELQAAISASTLPPESSSEEADFPHKKNNTASQARRINQLIESIGSLTQACETKKPLTEEAEGKNKDLYKYHCNVVSDAALKVVDACNQILNAHATGTHGNVPINSQYYENLKIRYQGTAREYFQKGNRYAIDQAKHALVNNPPPRASAVESLPPGEIVRISARTLPMDLDRLHERIAKDKDDKPLPLRDGKILYDTMVELTVDIDGVGQIKGHIHVNRPETVPLSAKVLLMDHQNDITYMSYQTLEHAVLPAGADKERGTFTKWHLNNFILRHPSLTFDAPSLRGPSFG